MIMNPLGNNPSAAGTPPALPANQPAQPGNSTYGCNKDSWKTVGFNAAKTLLFHFGGYMAGGYAGAAVTQGLKNAGMGEVGANIVGAMVNRSVQQTIRYVGDIVNESVKRHTGLRSPEVSANKAAYFGGKKFAGLLLDQGINTLVAQYGIPNVNGKGAGSALGAAAAATSDTMGGLVGDTLAMAKCFKTKAKQPAVKHGKALLTGGARALLGGATTGAVKGSFPNMSKSLDAFTTVTLIDASHATVDGVAELTSKPDP
jgi:hypothetical protein